jgi:hypothetical protein
VKVTREAKGCEQRIDSRKNYPVRAALQRKGLCRIYKIMQYVVPWLVMVIEVRNTDCPVFT